MVEQERGRENEISNLEKGFTERNEAITDLISNTQLGGERNRANGRYEPDDQDGLYGAAERRHGLRFERMAYCEVSGGGDNIE